MLYGMRIYIESYACMTLYVKVSGTKQPNLISFLHVAMYFHVSPVCVGQNSSVDVLSLILCSDRILI